MSEAAKAAHWPRILNGWMVDEAETHVGFTDWGMPTITATHLLSGVQLQWVDSSTFVHGYDPLGTMVYMKRVILLHPALAARVLTQPMEHDEALAYIETTVLGQ